MSPVYFAIIYSLLLLGAAGYVFWARQRFRQERAPFPESTRLLRSPGSSLERKIAALDEQIVYNLLIVIMLPAIGVGAMLVANWLFGGGLGFSGGSGALVVALLGTLGVSNRVATLLDRRRNTRLGLFGERIVAEHLEPLKTSGHRVFHDLPAGDPPTSHKNPYNIDHVVVGPAGVFAIETKTRRQSRSRVGVLAHEIIYDGRALAFPWGEDQHGLEQARRQADWLGEFLQRELGRPVPVHALLVFPGWAIIRKDAGASAHPVNVLNPRELPAAIERLAPAGHTGFAVPPLDPVLIDLIARQLEARCRDVEL